MLRQHSREARSSKLLETLRVEGVVNIHPRALKQKCLIVKASECIVPQPRCRSGGIGRHAILRG